MRSRGEPRSMTVKVVMALLLYDAKTDPKIAFFLAICAKFQSIKTFKHTNSQLGTYL